MRYTNLRFTYLFTYLITNDKAESGTLFYQLFRRKAQMLDDIFYICSVSVARRLAFISKQAVHHHLHRTAASLCVLPRNVKTTGQKIPSVLQPGRSVAVWLCSFWARSCLPLDAVWSTALTWQAGSALCWSNLLPFVIHSQSVRRPATTLTASSHAAHAAWFWFFISRTQFTSCMATDTYWHGYYVLLTSTFTARWCLIYLQLAEFPTRPPRRESTALLHMAAASSECKYSGFWPCKQKSRNS